MTQTFKPKASDATLAQQSLQASSADHINLPPLKSDSAIAQAIQDVLLHFSRGEAIQVVRLNEDLTTQQAADSLGISRPHLVKLLENGHIPFHKVGNQRRVQRSDVESYKRQLREAALNELSQLQQDMGLYA